MQSHPFLAPLVGPVRVLYPLLDAEMMQCCEELLVFPSQDATRRASRPTPARLT